MRWLAFRFVLPCSLLAAGDLPRLPTDQPGRLDLGPGETNSIELALNRGEFVQIVPTPDSGSVVKTALFDPAESTPDLRARPGRAAAPVTLQRRIRHHGRVAIGVDGCGARPASRRANTRSESGPQLPGVTRAGLSPAHTPVQLSSSHGDPDAADVRAVRTIPGRRDEARTPEGRAHRNASAQ